MSRPEERLGMASSSLNISIVGPDDDGNYIVTTHGERPSPPPPQYKTVPQTVANEITELAYEALNWFLDPDTILIGAPGYSSELTDGHVRAMIGGYQEGYMREYLRTVRADDPWNFTKLPMTIQRALIERWGQVVDQWLIDHPDIAYDRLEKRFFVRETGDNYTETPVLPSGTTLEGGGDSTVVDTSNWAGVPSPDTAQVRFNLDPTSNPPNSEENLQEDLS